MPGPAQFAEREENEELGLQDPDECLTLELEAHKVALHGVTINEHLVEIQQDTSKYGGSFEEYLQCHRLNGFAHGGFHEPKVLDFLVWK